jgi:hypothetical protein
MHWQRQSRARLELETLEDRCTPAIGFGGGAVVDHVQVQALFYGTYWSTSDGQQSGADINGYLSYLVDSPFMDTMNEYGVGRGAFLGNGIVEPGLLGAASVSDATIQVQIANDITAGRLPGASIGTLYIVFTPPNVAVISGGQSSLLDFFGYHDIFRYGATGTVNYAVIPNPVGNGTNGSMTVFQTITHTVSHELSEAVTDPDGAGWVDPVSGDEIADVADQPGNIAFLNDYVVAGLWSVAQQAVVYPAGSSPPDYDPSPDQIVAANVLAPVAEAFAHSPEYYNGIVRTYYQDFLGRSAGSSEQAFWAQTLEAGVRDEIVLSQILGSDEYFQRAGGTNQDWLHLLYQDLLNRDPDQSGANAWLNALSSGATRQQVASLIDVSAEREALVVGAYYQFYMGREGSNAEISGWVGILRSGATQEQVVTIFLGSPEFLTREGGTLGGWLTGVYETAFDREPDDAGFDAWIRILNIPFAS